MGSLPKKWQQFFHKFFSGYYKLLLLLLTLLFIFRPAKHEFVHLAVWQLLLTATVLSAIFNCNHKRPVKIFVSALAVPTVILCWANLWHPSGPIFVGNIAFIIIFMTACSTSVVFDVLLRARVTLETLRGVICAYLMVAFLFCYIYYLIEFIAPNSFQLISRESIFSYAEYISEFLYFSFGILLTMGLGDITPLTDMSQTFVIIEGMIGQFYVAILVARIVSVYAFYSDRKLLNTIERDLQLKKRGLEALKEDSKLAPKEPPKESSPPPPK